ncbi:MAG: preprotein translocase subunit SecY [Candidatus Pacebacteria bacterium]|nr:preprotein translocase subunit SecY [Candidatus Paceibacterota bacterium]MDD3919073.1 preprotein translocase subunit SecY [Candidatus Paceibacterota bacterium]
MFNKVAQILKTKELRRKILFVLAMFAVFRLMANIPIPGIDITSIQQFFAMNEFFGMLNLFTGGALDKVSIVMLGLGPYITATIIFQLLTMIIPKLEKLYKEEGEQGRQKFNQYARLATPIFAALQSYAMIMFLSGQGLIVGMSIFGLITSIIAITAGTVVLMWIGELISEKGIGNGVSLLIFAGIVADVPSNIKQAIYTYDPSQLISYISFIVVSILIIAAVIMVNEGRRNIPVSYAKRIRGNKMYGGVSTYLPMSLNPSGVIPIIFAISLLMLPNMIGTFLHIDFLSNLLSNNWIYGGLYFVLVFLFTFVYTAVTFDPKNVSSNLQKMGGFIPGVRPGQPTEDFIKTILNRLLIIGASFLGAVAIMPLIVESVTGVQQFSFMIGGTSLLIIVSVILETSRQIDAQLEMREYND